MGRVRKWAIRLWFAFWILAVIGSATPGSTASADPGFAWAILLGSTAWYLLAKWEQGRRDALDDAAE